MTTRLPSDGEHYFLGTLEENSTLFHDQSANTFIIQSNPTGTLTDIFAFDGNGITLTPVTDVLVADGTGMVIGHSAQVTGDAIGGSLKHEFQVLGTGVADSAIVVGRFQGNVQEPFFVFMKSRSASIGGVTIVNNGDRLGSIVWLAADGVDLATEAARFSAVSDGAPDVGDIGTAVTWNQMSASTAIQETMRITASGQLTLDETGVTNVTARGSGLFPGGIAFSNVANAWIDDATHGSGTVTHYIGNNTIDVTSSDTRMKINWSKANGLARHDLGLLYEALEEYNYVPEIRGGSRFVGYGAQHLYDFHPDVQKYVNVGEGENHWSVDYKYMVSNVVWGWGDHEQRLVALEERESLISLLQKHRDDPEVRALVHTMANGHK